MLEDAAKGPNGGLEVRDITEIIAERLSPSTRGPATA
jgi:hypothetical protein